MKKRGMHLIILSSICLFASMGQSVLCAGASGDLVAGLTGIILGAAPFNWQLSGSYFVVAHFHYMIVGGILFALFGAFYYWYPKFTVRMLDETLGKLHFWLFLIGFHLTFDFMHFVREFWGHNSRGL